MHRLSVQAIMRPAAVTIGPDELVIEAAARMEEHNIRRLPVVDEDKRLIGIVTDSDVLEVESAASALNAYEPDAGEESLAVADIMTREVVTIPAGATVGELAQLLLNNKFGGVPVVERDPATGENRLVGMVTEMDIFRYIAAAHAREQSAVIGTPATSAAR